MRQQRDPTDQIGAVLPEGAAASGLASPDDVVDQLQKLGRTVISAGHRKCGLGFTFVESQCRWWWWSWEGIERRDYESE